jgi:hypothetical protein
MMSGNIIFLLMYSRHKILDLIFCSLDRNRLIMKGNAVPVTDRGGL